MVKNMRKKCQKTIARCNICQKCKYPTQSRNYEMQNIITSKPNEILSIDFYGPLPKSVGGCKHILVTIDAFSKFVVLYPIKKATANIVAAKIIKNYIPKYGKPDKILCDHGTQFTAKSWKQKMIQNNIQVIFSSIRHPQSNIVERVNRELGRFFRTFVSQKHTGWFEFVPVIQCIINETCHDTTDITPIELHLGKAPQKIWKKWLKTTDNTINQAQQITLAGARIRAKRKKIAERTNEGKTFTKFDAGDQVLLKTNKISDLFKNKIAKFFHIYEGPFIIKKKVADNTYILKHMNNEKEKGMFHAANLKKYISQKNQE